MKKLTSLLLLSATMILASCGKPAESTPAESSETPTSSKPADSSKPASSSSQPASSSSTPAASSSTPAASSSTPAASSSTPAAHAHAWTAGAKTGKVTPETCGTEHKAYRLDVADAEGWHDPATKMNGKPTAEGPTTNSESKWTIEAGQLPAGKYNIEIVAKMTYDTHGTRHWYNQWETETESTGDKETESPFRYWVEVGETKYNPTATETWAELGYNATSMVSGLNAANVQIAAGATEIKLEHGNIGYSMIIESVRFVLVEAAPEVQAEVTYTGIDLLTENNKAYIKLEGTMTGVAATAQKLAFGLTHKAVNDVDDGTAGWLVGKETPLDADYTVVPTVAADGSFVAKIDVSGVTFATGAYAVYAGPKGFYKDITAELTGQVGGSAENSQFGGTKAKTATHKLYFRDDVNALIADELPPVALEEAFVEAGTGADAGKTFIFIGGTLGVAADVFTAYTPFLNFQQVGGSWTNYPLHSTGKVELVVRNGKGYVRGDISDLPNGNYNTHLNVKAQVQADCKMDVNFDTRENPTVVGNKAVGFYSNTAASQQAEFWGNLGVIISHAHNYERAAAKTEGTDMWPVSCAGNDITAVEMDTNSTNTPTLGSDKKMNSSKVANFNVTGIQAGEYAVYVKAHTSQGNDGATLAYGLSTGNDGGVTAEQPGRYYAQVGDGARVYTDTGDKNFNAIGYDDYRTFKWSNCAVIPSVMIGAGTTSFKFGHTGAGYSLYVESVRLVRIGGYVPSMAGTETAPVKMEAEDFTGKSNNFNPTVKEAESASGGKYISGNTYQRETQYAFNLGADANAKFTVRYSCYQDRNTYGALEFYVDGTKVDNFGSVTEGAANNAPVWATVEIPAQALTAGRHTVALRVPYNANTDFDYINVEFVAPAAE